MRRQVRRQVRMWRSRNLERRKAECPGGMYAVVDGIGVVKQGGYTGRAYKAPWEENVWMRGRSEMEVVDWMLGRVCERLGCSVVKWEPKQRTVLRWWRRVDQDGVGLLINFVHCYYGGACCAYLFLEK